MHPWKEKKNYKWIIILLLGIFFCTCVDTSKQRDKDLVRIELDSTQLKVKYEDKILSMPSPHYANLLLKKKGLEFNKDILNRPENLQNYSTSIKKALNLGVYGVDLGYLNIFNQTQEIYTYFAVIRKITEELELSGALDEDIYKDLERNVTKNDSIIYYLGTSFRKINAYLKNYDRRDIGAYILVGGWIESVYIISQYYMTYKDNELYQYITEQKYPLEKIIKILSPYYRKYDDLDNYIDKLVDLAYDFDAIDFEYQLESTIINDTNNSALIVSKTFTEYPSENLMIIMDKIAVLRNSIIE